MADAERRHARQRRHSMGKAVNRAPLLGALLAAAGLLSATVSLTAGDPNPGPAPVQLKQQTLDAFDRYVRLTEARLDEELRRGTPFLWVDSLPEPPAPGRLRRAPRRPGQN